MWTWLSRGALRHNRRHDPCSDHSNQQLFEVHSHSTVHDCSLTFCGKYIPLSLPNLPMEVTCPGKLPLWIRGFVTIHAWPSWIHSAYGAHHLSPIQRAPACSNDTEDNLRGRSPQQCDPACISTPPTLHCALGRSA